MKRSVLMVSLMFGLVFAVGGCATKGDLNDVHAREMAISQKADQASTDAQAARTAADAAMLKANQAVERAEVAERRAEERERIAEEKASQAELVLQKSMKK